MRNLRIRLLSDIHGNLPALESVLSHPDGISCDLNICLGDITGYGPWPSACIGMVKSVCDRVVAGNHDYGCAGLLELSRFNPWGSIAVRWSIGQMSPEDVRWLSKLPLEHREQGFGFCHSHPLAPGSWEYILSPGSAVQTIMELRGTIWFFGHTHIPCGWSRVGSRIRKEFIDLESHPLVNCGSVGQPRDGDPRAAFMIVDTVARTARTVRVDYPVKTTACEMRRVGLPEPLAERLFNGR